MNLKKFVAIGHVDTGKSCLCGHLLYKCGFIDKHSMNKIKEKAKQDKMEKWVWSRVLDIYEEEMQRGKTHEFNLVNFNYKENSYQLIDTPGHQIFVRSMIEGISQDVNICVLLVSMMTNEFDSSFENGMLKEHLILTRSLNIRHLIIVGNKMDAINWNQEIYNKNITKIKNFLKYIQWNNKFIYDIPISAFQGTGLTDNTDMPIWYKGKSFLDILSDIPNPKKLNIIKEYNLCNEMIVDIRLFNTKNFLVSNGFVMNCHYDGKECEITIHRIKDPNTKKKISYIQNTKNAICIIKVNQKINVYREQRIIFRKNNKTLVKSSKI
jgi:translation elongation factor EF-1alpha